MSMPFPIGSRGVAGGLVFRFNDVMLIATSVARGGVVGGQQAGLLCKRRRYFAAGRRRRTYHMLSVPLEVE